MKKCLLLVLSISFIVLTAHADKDKSKKKTKDEPVDSATVELVHMLKFRDSVITAMKYETGTINLDGGFAKLNIPTGFKFLNAAQSRFVLSKVWGNPERDDVIGMIIPAASDPFSDSSFAFVVSFDDMGYVKDGDANDVNYDKMLKEWQDSEAESNRSRAAMGYEPIHIVGWAQKPYYDSKRKVLHWAKNLKFGSQESNTLNYDVRVLGRKGVLSLNAIASMSELPLVQQNIDKVLNMAEFTDGNRYADYSSSNGDKIAAYTIGGLVAGKILTKVGFLALLLKFWKLIAAGFVGIGYAIKKFFKKKDTNTFTEAEDNTVS